MAKYRIDDVIVDTNSATGVWDEDTYWDGRNYISKPTGSQWEHQTLYRSAKGRYYLLHHSQWQGSRSHAEFVPAYEAAAWMLANGHELPDELATHADQMLE